MIYYNFSFLFFLFFISSFILFYIIYHIKDNKIPISNSLILFWDINCKKFIINYLNNNNISYKIIDYQQDVSTTLQSVEIIFAL
jgi:hypothetical protein